MFSLAAEYLTGQASDKGHKHGSSSRGSRRSNTNKHHSKPSKTRSSGAAAQETIAVSFLFVVNELEVNFERLPGDDQPLTDQWLNTVPPERADAYRGEIVGAVFRYQNGVISRAHEYAWYRPEMGHPGAIVRVSETGRITGYPAEYKTQTVFACSALLPMIVADGDASLGYALLRRLCACTQTFDEHCSIWSQLHFERRGRISFVNSWASGGTYAAGKDASWIPSLVPSVYQNTAASAEPSQGLAGELPIIIALMGFHGRPGRASDVFSSQKWHMGQWRGSSRASSHLPKSGETPRGLLVQVCADSLVPGQEDSEENNLPLDECRALLESLEFSGTPPLMQG